MARPRRYPYWPVMEGYSVKEAATVLGVPKRRVWELLARGVLAGVPAEGGGMRVHLRDAPAAPVRVADSGGGSSPDPAREHAGSGHAGNGGSNGNHDPSAPPSVFHDLLTEFRNLTERYGQALLALGEARGEVAGLRSRVELLEARLDLRLPGPRRWNAEAAATTQEAPAAPIFDSGVGVSLPPAPGTRPEDSAFPGSPELPGPEGIGPAADLPSSEPAPPEAQAAPDEVGFMEADAPRRPRKRRRGGSKEAVSGFAEALARAQDPTAAVLPEPVERRGREADQLAALDSVAPSEAVPTHELDAHPGLAEVIAVTAAEVSAPPVPGAPADEPSEAAELAAPEAPALAGKPEAPAQEAEPVAVEASPEYSAEWDEPDWIAEEDLDSEWDQPVAEPSAVSSGAIEEPAVVQEAMIEEPAAAAGEPEVAAEAPAIDELAAAPEAPVEESTVAAEELPTEERVIEELPIEEPMAADELVRPEAVAPMEQEDVPTDEGAPPTVEEEPNDFLFLAPDEAPAAGFPAEPEPAPPSEGEGPSPAPDVAASEAYEEELMWLGDEFRPSTSAWQSLGDESVSRPASRGTTPPEPPRGHSDDATLEQLARQRGWDDAELSAIRSLLGEQQGPSTVDQADLAVAEVGEEQAAARGSIVTEPAPEPMLASEPAQDLGPVLPLPGAAELDQAMSDLRSTGATSAPALISGALAAVPIVPDADVPERPGSGENTETDPAAPPEASSESESLEPPARAVGPAPPLPPPGPLPHRDLPARGDSDWLRGRRGPAANAYRRLRRLFPG